MEDKLVIYLNRHQLLEQEWLLTSAKGVKERRYLHYCTAERPLFHQKLMLPRYCISNLKVRELTGYMLFP